VATQTTAAVIGCGAISREHLSFLSTCGDVDLVAVCDLSPAIADYTAARYGAGSAYTDHREMLQVVRPQVVHVLTPPLSHAPLVTEALDAGCHVLCEKPITPDTASLRELLALAAANDRILMETQNLRFNDQLLAIDRLVRDGRLGTIVNVDVLLSIDIAHSKFADPNVPSAVANLAGGAIHDFLPHMAYLVLHYFGYPEVVDVRGSWRNVSGAPQIIFDEMEALITLPEGTASVRFSSRIQPDRFRLSVRGTEGTVETDLYQPYLRFETFRGRKQLSPLLNHAANGLSLVASSVSNLRGKILQHTPYHGMPRMLDALYAAVRHGTAPPITPLEMERTSLLIDAMAGQAVRS
jgi:predicted dehydrogenase